MYAHSHTHTHTHSHSHTYLLVMIGHTEHSGRTIRSEFNCQDSTAWRVSIATQLLLHGDAPLVSLCHMTQNYISP